MSIYNPCISDQIILRFRIIVENLCSLFAYFYLGASAASFDPTLYGTFTYFTKIAAKKCFTAVGTTSVATDMFRQNGSIIQLRPKSCGFFTQNIIIVFRCNTSISSLAIQSAERNIGLFHYNPSF